MKLPWCDTLSIQITCTLLLLVANGIVASTEEGSLPITCCVPHQLNDKLHSDPVTIKTASTDYGNIVHLPPSSVLYPSTIKDIKTLLKSSYKCPRPFVVSIRGKAHSVQGQSMAPGGVVVDMQEFKKRRKGLGVLVSDDLSYADVGGELLWSDVLNETLEHGVLPVSLPDYLQLTVGGTLSNVGINGMTFRFGPQISNVYELDVITGKGKLLTCSAHKNPELFYAVLGGLGQFGVITRARIPVQPAKRRVQWLQMLYTDFGNFTKDQERIIAINGRNQNEAVGFLSGGILLDNGTPNRWATRALPSKDLSKIMSLVKKYGVIYSIDIADPYDDNTKQHIDEKLQDLIQGLSPIPGMVYELDIPYVNFLSRVPVLELKNKSYPWLNLFVPRSRILDFNSGVIRDILLKRNITFGPVRFFPVNKNKWDVRTSLSIPDEDIFYSVLLLFETKDTDWKPYYVQNNDIIKFCDDNGIKIKTFLYSYSTKQEWVQHFGSKWPTIVKRKEDFDPKNILNPAQRIFNWNFDINPGHFPGICILG